MLSFDIHFAPRNRKKRCMMKLFQVNICTLRILVLYLQTESMY